MSFPSSGEWLPWSSISQNSVKDCDQLAGHGNEGEELGFASGDESVAESFELRVVACRDHGSNEQGTAHALATAANETLTTPLPGLTGPRCESDKSRDLSTIERTEFRQFGDQGAGDGFSNARHGKASASQARGDDCLEAASRLDRHQGR